MNRIKKIIEALKVVCNSPADDIKVAWSRVAALAVAEVGHSVEREVVLLGRIIHAVAAIAEDMEKEKPAKASAESEAAK